MLASSPPLIGLPFVFFRWPFPFPSSTSLFTTSSPATQTRCWHPQPSPSAMVKLDVPAFLLDDENPVGYLVVSLRDFFLDSLRLVRRCTKPDGKEFRKIVMACALGFFVMGLIGYFVKLMFIPINNILVGGS
eukprot:GHVT01070369.1.p2 GENE.GHVT01070369.1~~GHVT01070369.1.p2  ORF type:complete len:132 (-),score=17.66 GHVT01070369.1:1890-2285(-)